MGYELIGFVNCISKDGFPFLELLFQEVFVLFFISSFPTNVKRFLAKSCLKEFVRLVIVNRLFLYGLIR